MKISSGLSEIQFTRFLDPAKKTDKIFVWPEYNAGTVQKVPGITPRIGQDVFYSKPDVDEANSIIEKVKNNSFQNYRQDGSIIPSTLVIGPGSFFNALA